MIGTCLDDLKSVKMNCICQYLWYFASSGNAGSAEALEKAVLMAGNVRGEENINAVGNCPGVVHFWIFSTET